MMAELPGGCAQIVVSNKTLTAKTPLRQKASPVIRASIHKIKRKAFPIN